MARTSTKTKETTATKKTTKPESPRDEIKKLIDTYNECWYDISVKLYDIYTNDLYQTWGFETFEKYAQTDLSMSYRVAMYHVECGKTIKEQGFTKQQLKELTYTKFKALKPILADSTKEDTAKLLEEVKDKSLSEIEDFVKEQRSRTVGGEKSTTVKMSFVFTDEQSVIVENAIKQAMNIFNTDNQNVAMEAICANFLSSENDDVNPDIFEEQEEDSENINIEDI